jgi:hypothetical protein
MRSVTGYVMRNGLANMLELLANLHSKCEHVKGGNNVRLYGKDFKG